ncbi:hypothetical protein TRICI_006441 [Trichomonascus ciferrii]|uniref:Uncharacterized protein n=1 Tax=Trichomonascus ciferrii TaxID=44093 RepID=A0A642UJ97_9ASCO|nr:hypothetical protein TRICI_006441 [Trichomonascus ciferrii]
MLSVAGKRAVVTGASGGVGLACARGFLVHGARGLLLIDMNASELTKTSENLKKEFPDREIIALVANVAVQSEVKVAATYAKQSFRPINLVLACPWPGAELTEGNVSKCGAWQSLIDLNLNAARYTSVIFGDMLDEHGSIILISNGIAHANVELLHPAYGAAKMGLQSLKACLAMRYSDKNIRVNSVAPRYIQTPKTLPSYYTPKPLFSQFAHPDELVPTVLHLANNSSSTITSIDFVVTPT